MHPFDQCPAVGQLLCSEIHPDPQRVTVAELAALLGEVDGLVDHPVTDRRHQACRFGFGQELAGRDQTLRGVDPTDERLDARHFAVLEIDLGLKVEPELAESDRATDIIFELLALIGFQPERVLVPDHRLGTGELGPPAGEECVFDDVDGIGSRHLAGDAGTGPHRHDRGGHRDRLAHRTEQIFGDLAGAVAIHPWHHHDVRVALQRSDEALWRKTEREARSEQLQHLVAHSLPPLLVHTMKAVEVDVDHPGTDAGLLRCLQHSERA